MKSLKSESTPFQAEILIEEGFLRMVTNMSQGDLCFDGQTHFFYYKKKKIECYVGKNGYWKPLAYQQPYKTGGNVGTCFGLTKINGATYVDFQVSNPEFHGERFFLHDVRFEYRNDSLLNCFDITDAEVPKVVFDIDEPDF